MTTSTNSNQPLKINLADPNIILVYLDDANNNAGYFAAHHNARLIPYNRPTGAVSSAPVAGPAPLISANPAIAAAGVPASINNPPSGPTDTSNIHTGLSSSNNQNNSTFDFASVSLEGYGTVVDSKLNSSPPHATVVEGAAQESVPQQFPPFNINVDPASFVLQNNGGAGNAKFKCSVTYDVPDYTGDFNVECTQTD